MIPRSFSDDSGNATLRWLLYTLAILAALAVLLAALVFGIGLLLPDDFSSSRTILITKPPETVWAVMRDYASQPQWRPQVSSVERLPDQGGLETWRFTDPHGDTMTMTVVESVEPRQLINYFLDPAAAGTITWEISIVPLAADSQITLVQHAHSSKPAVRFLWRFFFGTRFADDYLKALARRFGDPPIVE